MSEPTAGHIDDRAWAEHNAAAWLALTDRELIERSASLGLPAELHPEEHVEGGQLATFEQLEELRANAEQVARDLAGDEFVDGWLEENRPGPEESRYVLPA
jgi:hypothetical protein